MSQPYRSSWLLLLLTAGFIVFIVVGAAFQVVNSQPWFCNSCHEMNFYYQTWQASQHHASARCLDCHGEPGVAGFIQEKVRGAEQVMAHVRGNYPQPIRIIIRVKNEQCVACHLDPGAIPDASRTADHVVHVERNVLCADCHSRLIHANAALHEPRIVAPDKCEGCHKRHADFPLTVGRHASADCGQCHPGGKYEGTSPRCESCHHPPAADHPGGNTNCQTCHSPESWTPAKVDHNKTALPLTGRHQQVACAKCYGDPFTKPASALCEACHKPPAANHPGGNTNCVACHSPEGWKPSKVDHNKTNFPLVGRHQQVACAKCHGDPFAKPASTACSACHAPPASHAGMAGTCDRCHTPQGFRPANFTHPRVGEHMPFGEKPLTCDRCHRTGVYTQHDCTGSGCHSSNNPKDD